MIVTFAQLSNMIQRLQKPPGFVLACGCFDVVTIGHVRNLQAAKQLGSYLCVLVTADQHVNKGVGRPLCGEQERLEVVSSLRCVD